MWTQYLLQKPKDILNQLPFYFSYLTCDPHLPSSPTMVWSIQFSWIAHRGFSARSKAGRSPHRNVIGILYLIVNLSQTAVSVSHTSPDTSSGEADPRCHFQSALHKRNTLNLTEVWWLARSVNSIPLFGPIIEHNRGLSAHLASSSCYIILSMSDRWGGLPWIMSCSFPPYWNNLTICPQQLVSILCRCKVLAYLVFVFFRGFLLTFWNYAGVIGTLKLEHGGCSWSIGQKVQLGHSLHSRCTGFDTCGHFSF